jgi:simple sugar transport system permease protein
MSPERIGAFISSSLEAGAPIAIAALGGLLTEASGSLSVALEGSMLAGAFAAALVAKATGSASLAFAAALLAGLLLALLVGGAALRLGADVFVAGLAANLLAPGAASLLSEALFGTKGVIAAPALAAGAARLAAGAPGAAAAPGLLFGLDPSFLVLLCGSALIVVLYAATPFGLRLRAAGEPNEAARAAGIRPGRLRLAAHLVAGGAAGLAGAALAAQVSAFVPGMSSGRGWIALVAIYLGGRRPGGVAAASLAFGFLIALSNAAQALSGAPAELLLGLPYAATALALVLARAASRRAAKRGAARAPGAPAGRRA